MKFESNIHGVIKQIPDCGNVDTAAIQETLDMQPEELREGEIINMNEEGGCDEKNEDVPEEVTLKFPVEVKTERILRATSHRGKHNGCNVGS